MPIYDIRASNGKILTIRAPDEAQALAGAEEWGAQQQDAGESAGGFNPLEALGAGADAAQGASAEGKRMQENQSLVGAAGKGVVKGLTDFAGMGADFRKWALSQFGVDMSDERLSQDDILSMYLKYSNFGGGKDLRGLADSAAQGGGAIADNESLSYENRMDLPKDARAMAAAGEVLGSAVGPTGIIRGVGAKVARSGAELAMTGKFLPDVVRKTVNMAGFNPGKFYAAEAAATAGGAQGAALAQGAMPDSELAPAVGQLAGSIVNPFSAAMSAAGGIKGAATGAMSLVNKGAAETRAAQHLSKLLNEAGEDAPTIMRNIEAGAADELAAPFSAADRSASPTLLGLQNRIAADNPDFAKQLAATRETGFENLGNTARAELGGDPAALTRAAETAAGTADKSLTNRTARAVTKRDEAVNAIRSEVDEFVSTAEREAIETASRFTPDAETQFMSNADARAVLDRAYDASRSAEKELWGNLDLKQRVVPDGFRQAVKDIQTRMLPGEALPAPVQKTAQYLTNPRVKRVTAETIQNTRSRLLKLARDASSGATPDNNAASVYRTLADGLLDDLAPVAGSDEARAFSRALNDRWTRTFVGQTQQTTGSGADKLYEGMTIGRAMTGAGPERARKMADLREAAAPLLGKTDDLTPDMRAAQEAYLRENVGRLKDPITGALNPQRAAKFDADNSAVLSAFPNVADDLTRAVSAGVQLKNAVPAARAEAATAVKGVESAFKSEQAGIDTLRATMKEQTAFARVLKAGERPDVAVTGALMGNNPTRDFRRIASLARRGGDEAVAGLRSATLDHLFGQAGKLAPKAGGFWHAVGDQLATPLGANKPNLMDALTGGKVLTATGRARMEQIVARGRTIERADATGRAVRNAGPATDMFVDQIIRTAGASYGAGVSVFGHSGATLSAASYGSRVFRKLLEDMPSQKAVDVLQKALGDDVLMKKLLQKVTPEREPGVIKAVMNAVRGARNTVPTVRGATIGAGVNIAQD